MTNVTTTCNQYRTYDEITDNWESLHSLFRYYTNYNPTIYNYSLPGSFNDPDQVTYTKYTQKENGKSTTVVSNSCADDTCCYLCSCKNCRSCLITVLLMYLVRIMYEITQR